MATPELAVHWLTTADAVPERCTPVMRQVLDAKRAHPDALVLFRLGDFYELFFEDALEATTLLELTLTSRNKNDPRPIPMCGFPYHSLSNHVLRAIAAGRRCAVVEQLEDPAHAKGIVQRGVTHVITPGVVLETDALDLRRSHNLVALSATKTGLGLAVADASTGWCGTAKVALPAALAVLLVRLEPRELVVTPAAKLWLEHLAAARDIALTERSGALPKPGDEVASALQLLRSYLGEVRPQSPTWLEAPVALDAIAHLQLPREAVQHLELLATSRAGKREGSLLYAVDETLTAGGARLLRSLLLAPLADRRAIELRQGAVAALVGDRSTRVAVRSLLRGLADLARLTARAAAGLCQPRELVALRDTLQRLPQLQSLLEPVLAPSLALATLHTDLAGTAQAAELLQQAVRDEPRAQVADGGVIRPGYDTELDSLVELVEDSQAWIDRYELDEKAKSGLPSLRVTYNRVSGFGIELARSRADQVPPHWHRKQTLKNVERYTTAELADFERRSLSADQQRLTRESLLWRQLLADVTQHGPLLRRVARALDELDVHAGFAEKASSLGWVRPQWVDAPAIYLKACRHPVVEQLLGAGQFVPNDVHLAGEAADNLGLPALDVPPAQLLLVTGPNMAGKSTLMRQVALCTILAHTGSFVPAEVAVLGICDAVLTRVGAGDDISEGASTFLVEMRETAQILQRATPRTLVLLDEIGRGTSTWDGLSIAWSVVEFLHDKAKALCLCATHYHELTHLAHKLRRLKNAHVAVREWQESVIFVHRLQTGPTSRSHGVAVARLAGLPKTVTDRAARVLEQLERAGRRTPGEVLHAEATRQLDLFDDTPTQFGEDAVAPPSPALAAIVAQLQQLDLESLSPRQAHQLLEQLAESAKQLPQ